MAALCNLFFCRDREIGSARLFVVRVGDEVRRVVRRFSEITMNVLGRRQNSSFCNSSACTRSVLDLPSLMLTSILGYWQPSQLRCRECFPGVGMLGPRVRVDRLQVVLPVGLFVRLREGRSRKVCRRIVCAYASAYSAAAFASVCVSVVASSRGWLTSDAIVLVLLYVP